MDLLRSATRQKSMPRPTRGFHFLLCFQSAQSQSTGCLYLCLCSQGANYACWKKKEKTKRVHAYSGVCNAVMRSVSEIETECDHSNALRPKFTNLFKCVVLKCLSWILLCISYVTLWEFWMRRFRAKALLYNIIFSWFGETDKLKLQFWERWGDNRLIDPML